MYRLIACWSAPSPEDQAEFERYYEETHVPLAQKAAPTKRWVLTSTDAGLEGAEPGFYRVAEVGFDSPEELEKVTETPEWQALREDAGKMIERFGVTLTMGMGQAKEAAPAAAGPGA